MPKSSLNSTEAKQKAASVAQWEQKLTTFEELYNEATPEERKDLLRLYINYLIYNLIGFNSPYLIPVMKQIGPKFSKTAHLASNKVRMTSYETPNKSSNGFSARV